MPKQVFIAAVFLAAFAAIQPVSAQQTPATTDAPKSEQVIRGTVTDSQSGHAIEYANVVLYKRSDSTMVQGTVTDVDGRFDLSGVPKGSYYLEVRFMGFESEVIERIDHSGDVTVLDEISLVPAAIELDEVEIAADRAPVTYQIDKKVINVERQLTATSGTAVDVLTNVPSVTVDLEGSVQLRGSGSFTVLIDGRPSTLEGSEALEQIPASSIESIEIITNPSAKYDPQGVSGIINVIMKKDGKAGWTGVFNAGAGTLDEYLADATVTLRGDAYSVFFGADYSEQGGERESEERSTYFNPNETTTINSEGISERQRQRYGVRGGFDLSLTNSDKLGGGFRYGYREFGRLKTQDYTEQVGDNAPISYLSLGDRGRGGDYYSANLDYEHLFDGEDHKLSSQVSFRHSEGEERTMDELLDAAGNVTSGRISTEDGPSDRLHGRLDYQLPMGSGYTLETGYETNIGMSEEATSISEYDTLSNAYIRQTEFDRSTTYDRNIHAVYALTRGELGAFGIQLGLRGEYTDRLVDAGPDGIFTIDRWDYFPTVHTSYKLSETQQFMASYTRRIDRPRGWYLEPFLTWMDAYNVRTGNPDLKPEYIDSYELGYQTHIGENMFSVEGYHRIEENSIERIRSAYRENISIWMPMNVGTETSSGVELMLNTDPVAFWDVYLLGNLYNYKVEGDVNGQSIDAEKFTWNVRFNNTFKITQQTLLQINAQYNSAEVEAQQREEDYYVVNLAVRQDLFQRRLAVTLNWDDVFHTAKREQFTDAVNLSSYEYELREAPNIVLSVKYFLNTRPKPNEGNRNGEDIGDDDF